MIVDLFFAILNLAVLGALFVYAIRTYLIPQVREKIMEEFNTLMNLKKEHHQLRTVQNTLEDGIAQQEDSAKHLFKKINHWRNTVDLEREAEDISDKILLTELNQKVERQMHNYSADKQYEVLAPFVYSALKMDLKKRYTDPEKAREYMSSVLTPLTKRSP